ncbi:MAG: hypothetical protein A2Z88_11430 [Omnitrophica WOR_2 bacterium GWA2_47_8]|nr:MAG: hypothetical protein A2Z88_11430 [Omnitrophica WOR_2 bacterium GWA2_47_8]
MIKQKSKWSYEEVKEAVARLSPRERLKLLEALEDKLFAARMREITSIIRSKAKTNSPRKIAQAVKRAQRRLYAKTQSRT